MEKKEAGKKKYKAVILDFDGTVMDSVRLVSLGWKHSAKKVFGEEISLAKMKKELHGAPEEVYLRMRTHYPKAFHPDRYHDQQREKEAWIDANRHLGKAFSDVDFFLSECKERGLKIALVTSSKGRWVRAYPAFRRIIWEFDCLVFSEATRKKKPDPEPFLHAARKMRIRPGEILSIGDGTSDAIGSIAAGMDFAGVTTGTSKASELRKAGAKRCFGKLSEVLKLI